MKKIKLRFLSVLMAVMLGVTAVSIPALAAGGEDVTEVTGGIEPETEESNSIMTDEAEADTDTGAAALTEEEAAALLSSLLGSAVNITATDEGIQITTGDTAESHQTGTVTTGGGRLNVRTGAGLDNTAFTQLPNGTAVEVVGTDGEWVKILLPERIGYVHSDYLTVSEAEETGTGSFSLSLSGDELTALLELFMDRGSAALTPDGNLTLIDDIGSTTQSGKQFITVESKNGNVFYLIIDRDDDGEETVHFLNQVDEADLLALMEDGDGTETPAACTCTEKCVAGAVDTSCPVCATNMTECMGKEPEPAEPEDSAEAEPEPEKSGGAAGGILVVLLLAALMGGGAFAYLKFVKNKPQKKAAPDPDDYDFDDDEEDGLDDTEALDEDYDEADMNSAESEDA